MNSVAGLRVFIDPYCVDGYEHLQVRFPKSKKKRIRKKWRWRSRNWISRPIPAAFISKAEGTMICHPAIFEVLRRSTSAAFPANLQ